MSKVDENLSNILNTDYIPVVREDDKPITIHQDDSANPDADYSRSNYYNLIEKGNEALDGILEVAKESQHPRAYEVAANMIKNLSDVTEKLMILQKQQKELRGPQEQAQQQNINVEKAVFVGSTAELLKQLKNESNSG
jgi:signal recognition particle subunit SEC65